MRETEINLNTEYITDKHAFLIDIEYWDKQSQRVMAHYGIESLTLKETVPGTFVLPFWTRFRGVKSLRTKTTSNKDHFVQWRPFRTKA